MLVDESLSYSASRVSQLQVLSKKCAGPWWTVVVVQ